MVCCKSDKKGIESQKLETKQSAVSEKTQEDSQQIASESQIENDSEKARTINPVTVAGLPSLENKESLPKNKVEKPAKTKPKKKKKKSRKVTIHKKPKIEFEELVWDFGEITEGDIIEKKFKFINAGNAPLEIIATSATCGCTRPSFPFLDIAPGESNVIGVTYNSVGKDGEQSPEITIEANTTPKITTLKLKGTVKPKPQTELVPDSSVSVKDSIVSKQK